MHIFLAVVWMILASIGLAGMKEQMKAKHIPVPLYRISFGTVVVLFLTYAFVYLQNEDEMRTISSRQLDVELSMLEYMNNMLELRKRGKFPRPDGFHYLGMEDFLLQHGRWYTPQPLPSTVKRLRIKECFRNSLMTACEHGYKYVEGLAFGCVMPVHHAWNVDDKGNVIDTTWESGEAYFGVEFPIKLVLSKMRDGMTPLDDWKSWEVYRKPWEIK